MFIFLVWSVNFLFIIFTVTGFEGSVIDQFLGIRVNSGLYWFGNTDSESSCFLSGRDRFHCFMVWALPSYFPNFCWDCEEDSTCYILEGGCGWTKGNLLISNLLNHCSIQKQNHELISSIGRMLLKNLTWRPCQRSCSSRMGKKWIGSSVQGRKICRMQSPSMLLLLLDVALTWNSIHFNLFSAWKLK